MSCKHLGKTESTTSIDTKLYICKVYINDVRKSLEASKKPYLSRDYRFVTRLLGIRSTYRYMKKVILIGLFLTLFTPVYVGATSGACSYHGGVSCSAEADFDGSAICNDGTRDSSVPFNEVQECKVSLNDICPRPYFFGATNYSICDQYQSICDSTNTARENTCAMAGIDPSNANCAPVSCTQADQCRNQVQRNTTASQNHDQCVNLAIQSQALEEKRQEDIANTKLEELSKENLSAIQNQVINKPLEVPIFESEVPEITKGESNVSEKAVEKPKTITSNPVPRPVEPIIVAPVQSVVEIQKEAPLKVSFFKRIISKLIFWK